MIRSSGVVCDVCGNHVMGIRPDDTFTFFSVGFIEQELTAHTRGCVDLMRRVSETHDITLLPEESPVREAYESAFAVTAREVTNVE